MAIRGVILIVHSMSFACNDSSILGMCSTKMGTNLDMTITVNRDMKQQLIIPFDHLTPVSGVGLSPTRGTCETSRSACGCARCFFFLSNLPFSPQLQIGTSHMS